MYKFENVNPKKRKVGDCVIRAIAKAENKSWLEIFDSLTEIARKDFTVVNWKDCYNKYLSKYQKIDVKYAMKDGTKRRYKVKDVCFMQGTYVIALANHLTAVIDGAYYDIWDCGDKCAYQIWKIK